MKLTNKKLEKLVLEVLTEVSTGGTGLGGAKSKGYRSDKGKEYQRTYDAAVDVYDTHAETEPDTKIPDTDEWKHPYSGVKTKVTKKSPQPALGWQTYHPSKAPKGLDNAGDASDYTKAAKSLAKGWTISKKLATTNPDKDNPAWTTWDTQRGEYETTKTAAQSDLDTQKEKDKEQEKPKDPKSNGVEIPKVAPQSGRSGPGTGGKKGKGKKGKGKKGDEEEKNESINIGDKKMAKLQDLLSEVFDETPKVNKHKVIEGVSNYGSLGRKLYGENNLVKIAEALVDIAESAHSHILGEQGDWFDKVTVNKNMKHLKTQVKEFKIVANEANSVNQRLTSLYEDMGHILNRYYDINEEELDKHSPEELDNDFKDREDKDIDNDGDTDDSDEFLHKKRQAITKAVKETAMNMSNRPTRRLKDVKNSVVSTSSVGYFKNKK